MASQVMELKCPGCGAGVSIEQKTCKYCGRPIVVSSFTTVDAIPFPEIGKYVNSYQTALVDNPTNADLNSSLAFCHLKLKRYDIAVEEFRCAQLSDINNSELYFYEAVSLLKGKKAFLNDRQTINKILECIEAAKMIEPRGIYYYFEAYIRYDYFYRKHLNVFPDYSETLSMAHSMGVSEYDITQLFSMLNVQRPSIM